MRGVGEGWGGRGFGDGGGFRPGGCAVGCLLVNIDAVIRRLEEEGVGQQAFGTASLKMIMWDGGGDGNTEGYHFDG